MSSPLKDAPVQQEKPAISRRRSVRFAPDPGAMAQLDLKMAGPAFLSQAHGLVLDESHKGCSVIVTSKEGLAVGVVCRVKVGRLDPLKAEVRWVKDLDRDAFKIGLSYLE